MTWWQILLLALAGIAGLFLTAGGVVAATWVAFGVRENRRGCPRSRSRRGGGKS
jgi:hypothetical protein